MSAFQFGSAVRSAPSLSEKLVKLQAMLNQRRDRLIFVADFDHTLTTMHSSQCHDPICYNPLLPTDFHKGCTKIMNTPMSDWNQWWLLCHDYVVREANLTANIFRDGLNSFDFQFRDHCHELFHTLHTENIPSFIVSAGVQNVIEEVIAREGLPVGQHVQFFTNRMVFDEEDRLQTFEPPLPVTSQTKCRLPVHLPDLFAQTVPVHATTTTSSADTSSEATETTAAETPKYDVALVLGDNVWDFSVLKDLPHFETINVGFATHEEKADTLMEKGNCDVVLIGSHHDMQPVAALLRYLLDADSSSDAAATTTTTA